MDSLAPSSSGSTLRGVGVRASFPGKRVARVAKVARAKRANIRRQKIPSRQNVEQLSSDRSYTFKDAHLQTVYSVIKLVIKLVISFVHLSVTKRLFLINMIVMYLYFRLSRTASLFCFNRWILLIFKMICHLLYILFYLGYRKPRAENDKIRLKTWLKPQIKLFHK